MNISGAKDGAASLQNSLPGTVRHLAGVLWYDMLSAMNKTGLDAGALGPGGDEFQSLFMWNIAQNDFGSYDTQLTNAAVRQLGGAAPPATDIAVSPPLLPPPTAADQSPLAGFALNQAGNAAVAAESLATAPEPALATGPLLDRAKGFAAKLWPGLQAAAASLGVPAVGLLAQAALETNWGASAPGHNLFGIKASPGQPTSWQPTHEMQAGVMVPTVAAFRAYGSAGESIADYVRDIRNLFPQAVGQASVAGFAQALQAGGYATDRLYAAKIVNLAGSPLMAAAVNAATGGAATPRREEKQK